jgi:pimeloyl-ACP methyl ester carboxylesterase
LNEVTGENPLTLEELELIVNDNNIYCLKAGSGPPVVFVHGGASDSDDWVYTMKALASEYSVYAPDLIGFGRNERNENGYYLSDFSDFLLQFIETLRLVKPALVGHSFGARVCLDAAIQSNEKISRLVLIDASGLGEISRFGSAVLTVFWAIRKLLRQPQPYPKFLVRDGDNYNHVGVDKLAGLKVPTLLVWKRYDPYLPLSNARQAAELIPEAELVIVPGFGHAPHKADPDAFNVLLRNFLSGKLSGTPKNR